jgi:hypothetical protein
MGAARVQAQGTRTDKKIDWRAMSLDSFKLPDDRRVGFCYIDRVAGAPLTETV